MAAAVIVLDTSGLYALVNRADPGHRAAADTLAADAGPYLVAAGTLAEIAYLVERRLGTVVLDRLLGDFESGALGIDCGEDDMARIRQLVTRYASLPLGFADAAVVACAERHGGRILTFDRRDFDVVAGEGRIVVVPA